MKFQGEINNNNNTLRCPDKIISPWFSSPCLNDWHDWYGIVPWEAVDEGEDKGTPRHWE